MKYWLFSDNQVEGPYDREGLLEIESFSPESLVCPEGRRGTSMGDWQRAGVVAELAETLLKKARVPAGAAPMSELGGSLLPPEPTLRDLAVLGTLQEKVSLLENALSQFQEDLKSRDEEISSLKTDLDLKKQETENLETKLGELESKLKETDSIKEEVGRAKELSDEQSKTIDDLRAQLDAVRGDIEDVRTRAMAPAGAPEASSPPEPDTEGLPAALTGEPEPLAAEPGGLSVPDSMGEGPAPLGGEPEPFPAPMEEAASGPSPFSPSPEGFGPEEPPALEITPDPAAGGGLEAPGEELSAPGLEPPPLGEGGEQTPPGLISPFENMPDQPGGTGPISLEAPPPLDPSATTPGFQDLNAPQPMGELPNTLVGPPGGTDPFGAEAPPLGGEAPPLGGEAPVFGGDAPPMSGMPTPFPTPGVATPIPGDLPATGPAPFAAGTPADMASVAGAASGDGLMELTGGDIAAPAAAAPAKKGGKLVVILLVLAILGGGAGAAVYMGFIDIAALTGGKTPAESNAPKLKEPTPPATSPTAPADEGDSSPAAPPAVESETERTSSLGQPDRTQDAVRFAKEYVIRKTGKSLGLTLEGGDLQPGLEPWTVNMVGDDRYEVNFYETVSGIRSRIPTYQFEVRLRKSQLTALNAKSQAVLDGKSAAPEERAPKPQTQARRKPRPRRASRPEAGRREASTSTKGLLADPLGSMLMEDSSPLSEPEAEPAGRGRASSRRRPEPAPAPEADKEETVLPPEEEKSARTRSRRHRAPSKSREELTLDELLLPGVPKQ